jgi:hypothetical protein
VTTQTIDSISPTFIGADMIDIAIDDASKPLTVGKVITLNFGYSRTLPGGLVKPLKLIVQPAFGSGAGYIEETFDTFIPDSFAFQVQGAGQYLVVLREVGHNQWQGRVLLDVAGDQFQEVRTGR